MLLAGNLIYIAGTTKKVEKISVMDGKSGTSQVITISLPRALAGEEQEYLHLTRDWKPALQT